MKMLAKEIAKIFFKEMLLDGQMVSEVEDSEYKYLGVLKGGYTLRKIR